MSGRVMPDLVLFNLLGNSGKLTYVNWGMFMFWDVISCIRSFALGPHTVSTVYMDVMSCTVTLLSAGRWLSIHSRTRVCCGVGDG